MSIANAMNNAISGLTAAARGTEVVSSNLANALTPGYARRELNLSPRLLASNGGGVQIDGISRVVADSLIADFRVANAGLARSSVSHDFYRTFETAIGQPQDGGSLSGLMAGLETALASAASRPDSPVRLRSVFEAADQLAKKVGAVSNAVQESRTQADRRIGLQVNVLNEDLNKVADLNRQIIVERTNGRDSGSLEDARQALVDRISTIVPIREMTRENGRIALFTTGGLALLDGKTPTAFGFNPTGRLTPDIDQSSALLGQLTIDGEPASTVQMSLMSGGSLSELLQVRDVYGVKAQSLIDGIAREVYDRFADPALDGTIAPGGPGLFTDGTGALDPTTERGLSARLRVNPAVDETNGGKLWRIRDGINATVEGDTGDSTLIHNLSQALTENRPYGSNAVPNGEGSVATLVANILSEASSSRLAAEQRKTHDLTLKNSLQGALMADGVDSDHEMQMLLQLEKAYAANAKVIQAVDEMLDNLLRI